MTKEREGKRSRIWAYSGLEIKNTETLSSTEHITFDQIWREIADFTYSLKGWNYVTESSIVSTGNENDCKIWSWVYIEPNIKCNNSRVIREIRIDNNCNISLTVMGRRIALSALPIPAINWQLANGIQDQLANVFEKCSSAILCTGFKVDVTNNTFNGKGEIIGKCDEWLLHKDAELRHRALDCDSILLSGVSCQQMCKKCSRIKHNSFYKTLNLSRQTKLQDHSRSGIKFKRESWMSDGEKIQKLQEAKKKIQHISKQNSYMQKKIEAVMYEFDDEDNSDFQHMFKLIDKNEIPEDLLLFYNAQLENLGKKCSKGYRWHPK